MEFDKKDQEDRIKKLGNMMERTIDPIDLSNLVDRACCLGLPEGMFLTDFEDYIRSLYPERYVSRKRYKDIGKDTGYVDQHLTPIKVGDHMTVPEHNNQCCAHWIKCKILWNEEWKAYGMRSEDGRWISGMGIAGGFKVVSQ